MKRHSMDMVSLVFGLIFASAAAWWLVGRYVPSINVNIPHVGVFAAAVLIVLGLLGIVASLRRDRVPAPVTSAPPEPTGWVSASTMPVSPAATPAVTPATFPAATATSEAEPWASAEPATLSSTWDTQSTFTDTPTDPTADTSIETHIDTVEGPADPTANDPTRPTEPPPHP